MAGAIASMGAARLTLLNAAVRFDYPARRPAGALLAAAAAGALVFLLQPRWARAAAAAFSVAALLVAAHLLRYRVEAGASGLMARGLLASRQVAWEDVLRVEARPGVLLLTASGDDPITIDTTDFGAADRAALDRVIARRLGARSH